MQQIADDNDGNRADQTSGYQASVDYVLAELAATGWQAQVVPFTYAGTDTLLTQLTPTSADFDSGTVTGSDEGDVTGRVVPVDLNLDGDRSSTSGCESDDFAGLDWSGDSDIALVQRGTCPFGLKVENAEAAGAEAVVIFNQGNTEDREVVLSNVTLGGDSDLAVVGASFDAGVALAADGATARVSVDEVDRTSFNVIAELPGKTDDNVVMAGAHLDSVEVGPGINDNGSGSAALLEVAQQMSKSKPQNTVRFAWWGAEEIGLIGSTQWVEQRTEAELADIALYLNFDMVGSPNYVFQVYDANESTSEAPVEVPEGSVAIEKLFESFYTLRNEPYDDSEFSGRSDYEAFIDNGIPSSGLFTGAEEIKTEEQADIWGRHGWSAVRPVLPPRVRHLR